MTEEPEAAQLGWQLLDATAPDRAAQAVAAADVAVKAGRCVVVPTDTVYGIGADAFSPAAVNALLEAKGRGRDMPPPVLIADPAVLMAMGRDIPDPAKKLAESFWPGPLTLILYAQSSLLMDLGDTEGTIAVRVPDHDLARQLLRATGPLAVSSANRTGAGAATTVQEAIEQLGDRVSVYLDAGPTPGPVPSTIVDFTRSEFGVVVRRGRLGLEELREVVPYLEEDLTLAALPADTRSPETRSPDTRSPETRSPETRPTGKPTRTRQQPGPTDGQAG